MEVQEDFPNCAQNDFSKSFQKIKTIERGPSGSLEKKYKVTGHTLKPPQTTDLHRDYPQTCHMFT